MGTSFMATKEFQVGDKLKNKIVRQEITDSEYCKKVYGMEHGGIHSLAAGVIDSIPSVKQYIDGIIKGAEQIVAEFKQWGMVGD